MPVGNLEGLISLDLKCAKNNSHGEASYECGPVKRTGILNCSNTFRVYLLVWYGALSNIITVSFLQLDLSLSNLLTKLLKKISIILLLEFDYIKERYI